MKNKLFISMALLAAGIAAASCEKTPSGESGADAQNQSGSTTLERQSDGATQAQAPPDKSPDQAARAAHEQHNRTTDHAGHPRLSPPFRPTRRARASPRLDACDTMRMTAPDVA